MTNNQSDDPQTEGKKLLTKARALLKQGQVEEARKLLLAINRTSHGGAIYAGAQLILADSYLKQQDFENANKHWFNIKRDDDKQRYAQAQFNLGLSYYEKQDVATARRHWKKIKPGDDKQLYAQAQLNLGVCYTQKQDVKNATKHWLNIARDDDKQQYAQAQFNLGLCYYQQQDSENATKYWLKVEYNENFIDTYIKAQIWLLILRRPEIEHCKDKLWTLFYTLNESVQKLLKNLFIKPIDNNSAENPENKFAHYTSSAVAEVLLKGVNLRLGIANFMNDPTEGQLLAQYLALNTTQKTTNPQHENYAFLTCFSFNHNSLNQFRLYGKKNHIEGSGLSLVVTRNFFSDNNKIIYATSKSQDNKYLDETSVAVTTATTNTKKYNDDETKPIEKLALFRCIYLEPQSGYLNIAGRSKITFYLEAKNTDSDTITEEQLKQIEGRWKIYQTKIEAIRKEVTKIMGEIKDTVTEINTLDKTDNLSDLTNTLLLRLQYLIKHAAFEEEAECRIIYIIDLNSNKVKTKDGRLYVEYAPSVIDHLKKIYIGPKADKSLLLFSKKLLQAKNKNKDKDNQIMVRQSEMPLA